MCAVVRDSDVKFRMIIGLGLLLLNSVVGHKFKSRFSATSVTNNPQPHHEIPFPPKTDVFLERWEFILL